MDDNREKQEKKDPARDEAAVQAELERQLRDLGVSVNDLGATVGDAFRHGFEGRGDELGRQVSGVADDVTAILNSVVDEVAGAFREAAQDLRDDKDKRRAREQRRRRREARRDGYGRPEADAPYDYAAQFEAGPGRVSFGRWRSDRDAAPAPGGEGGYVRTIRWSARKRFGIGLALAATCGILAFSFFVGGIACLVGTEAVLADSVAEAVLVWTGIGLFVGGGLCTGGALYGGEQLEASKLLRRCADTFDGLDLSDGVDLDDLAGLVQIKKKKLRKQLREYIGRGWLAGWLDEKEDCLYLSAADYRAAHHIPAEPQTEFEIESETKLVSKMTATAYPEIDGGILMILDFGYDYAGRLTSISDQGDILDITVTYGNGQVTQGTNGETCIFSLDDSGRVTSCRMTATSFLLYSYESDKTIIDGTSSLGNLHVVAEYDDNGNVIRIGDLDVTYYRRKNPQNLAFLEPINIAGVTGFYPYPFFSRYPGLISRDLVKTIGSSTYTYDFDDDGFPLAVYRNGKLISKFDYIDLQ